MFRFATTVLLTTLLAVNAVEIPTKGSVPLESAMGQALLRNATVIEPARHLNNNINNQNQGNAVYLGKYEIKYLGCNSLLQSYSEAANSINISNIQTFLDTQQLVRFALCPTNSCDSCNGGGEYAVNMADFLDGYTEAKLSEEAYACEMVREACYCGDADDVKVCESACYTSADISCTPAEGEVNSEIQRYLECAEIKGRNNNESQSALYVGPYCADNGNSIHLGVFDDNTCTTKAATNLYASRTGSELPFANQSIITTSGCVSCHDTQNNNEINQVQNEDGSYKEVYAVTDHCIQAYERAVKCEKNTTFSTKDTSGCEFLESVLPRFSSASQSSGANSGKNSAALAWIYAMTIAFGPYF